MDKCDVKTLEDYLKSIKLCVYKSYLNSNISFMQYQKLISDLLDIEIRIRAIKLVTGYKDE